MDRQSKGAVSGELTTPQSATPRNHRERSMPHVPEKPQRRKSRPIVTRYSRWIRLYTEILNDPKVQTLDPYTFRAWINMLAMAGEHPQGVLPSIGDIAFKLRMSTNDAQQQVNQLIDLGLLDITKRTGDGVTLRPHNWDSRQFASDSSVQRTREWRERKAQNDEQRHGDDAVTSQSPSRWRPDSDSVYDSDSQEGRSVSEVSDNTNCDDGDGYWRDDGEWRLRK